jgi:membrane associated rhomboid family serine protease
MEQVGVSMSGASMNPLEAILRMCAAAAPEAWYPRVYIKQSGADPVLLDRCLELLRLEGLIRKVPGTPETGHGIALSPEGERVLQDPAAVERLRNGQPIFPESRGSIIRQALRERMVPWVTRLLLASNLAVFAFGAWLASNVGKTSAFFKGFPVTDQTVLQIAQRCGAVNGQAVLRGEWWRLLSAAFVHFGVLHLLLNMYMLYAIGSRVERAWGRGRYLLIYFFSAWGGSCLAVAYTPQILMAGASGALCGILAADAVWVLLNGRYLPREMVRREKTNMVINAMLIGFISLFAGVSGLGHLGGALAGAATAFLLNVQRFNRPPLRWVALLALVVLPFLGTVVINRQRTLNPDWRALEKGVRAPKEEAEQTDFEKRFLPRIQQTARATETLLQGQAQTLLEMHPKRRDKAALDEVLSALSQQGRELTALKKELANKRPYQDEAAEEARQASGTYLDALGKLVDLVERCLRQGEAWSDRDEESLKQQFKQVQDARQAWRDLLD